MRVDTATLARVPSLNISGEREPNESIEDTRLLWAALRGRGGAAAFSVHAGQPHKSLDGVVDAGPAMRKWAEAMIRRRAGSAGRLSPFEFADGWLVSEPVGEAAAVRDFHGDVRSASWLPDAPTAFAFRQLSGMCAPVGQPRAAALLGDGTKLEAEDTEVCHFVLDQPKRDLWLSVYTTATDSAAVAWLKNSARAVPLSGIGSFANFLAQPKQHCSTVGGARSVVAFFVSACGDGFGVAPDSSRLVPMLRRLMGLQ